MTKNSATAAPQLDGENLAMLLDEVSAMAASQRSLAFGMADIENAAMGRLARAAGLVRHRIEQGHAPGDAIAGLSPKFQTPIRAAMKLMAETGSTEPIRETVRMIRQSKEHRRHIVLAAINPMLNLVIGATVVFFVMPWILTSISDAEMIRPELAPTAIEIGKTFQANFWIATLATLAVIAVFAALFYGLLLRSNQRTEVTRNHAVFCRWLAMQINGDNTNASGGIETSRVIETAASVVHPAFEKTWTSVAENIRGGAQTASALAIPATTPPPVAECVVDLIGSVRDWESISIDLRRLSELYDQSSRQQRSWWIDVFPKWVTSIVMIAIILLITQTMLAPLMEVFSEVTG